MLFSFLKYLQPTHYFALSIRGKELIFPKIDGFITTNYNPDSNYKSDMAIKYDQSWRALQNGYINFTDHITEVVELSIYDNYVFVRKYFNRIWVLYILMIRILSLKNPIKEFKAFFKTSHIDRYIYDNELVLYNDYRSFKSKLLKDAPLISVIIPTLNRYDYLKDVLNDLEKQVYTNFEVIIIDQSEPFQDQFYENYNLNLKVQNQQEKALWLARNSAIKQSKGDFILLFDDDSRVESDWIIQHIKTLDFFNVDISSGISISKVGDRVPIHYSYFKISDQLDTGNVLIRKKVFKTCGLFDRQFEKQRMGDGEFGLRSFLNGFKNISNPYAKRLHLKVSSGGLRDMGSWDAFRTKNLFEPRPMPSVLYFFRNYFGTKNSILAIIRTVPLSIIPYKYKSNKLMLVLSSIIAILVLPLLFFQVFRSWYLASIKLNEGAIIEKLP